MKNITNYDLFCSSDLINIETFKQLLKMLSNDIKDAKQNNTPPNEKAKIVFSLSIQRADLLQNAQKNYPQINWIDKTLTDTPHNEARKQNIKLITMNKFGFNLHK